MKSILSFLLFLASALVYAPTQAHADDAVVERFRAAALRGLEQAQRSGVTEANGIPLAEIKNKMQSIAISYDKNLRVQEVSRSCAFWQPASAQYNMPAVIRLNKDCAALSEEQMQGIALHESLGVGANADRRYEISAKVLSGDRLNSKMLKSKTTQSLGGGSTGVGGGGDFRELTFKIAGLKQLNQAGEKFHGIPVAFVHKALSEMQIYVVTDSPQMLVVKNNPGNEGFVLINKMLFEEKYSHMLPRLALVAARALLLQNTSWYDLSEDVRASEAGDEISSSPKLTQPYLYIPYDKTSFRKFENPELVSQMTPAQQQAAQKAAELEAQTILHSEQYQDFSWFQDATLGLL